MTSRDTTLPFITKYFLLYIKQFLHLENNARKKWLLKTLHCIFITMLNCLLKLVLSVQLPSYFFSFSHDGRSNHDPMECKCRLLGLGHGLGLGGLVCQLLWYLRTGACSRDCPCGLYGRSQLNFLWGSGWSKIQFTILLQVTFPWIFQKKYLILYEGHFSIQPSTRVSQFFVEQFSIWRSLFS